MERSAPETDVWSDAFPLEPAGDDRFRVELSGFGGDTLGCATLAVARSCPERALHSLHTSFLRPVTAGAPADVVVERLRDGRRFSHRRARVEHGGRLCVEVVASFAVPGAGIEHQEQTPDPGTPAPETLPSENDVARAEGWADDEPGPLGGLLEWRFVGGTPWHPPQPGESAGYHGWVRPRAPFADAPQRAAALALLSDYHSHMAVARRLGGHFEPMGYVSLDQLLWVHRDDPWRDWWLIHTGCDVAHGGRALTRRSVYTRGGLLVATMVQEQLVPFVDAGAA